MLRHEVGEASCKRAKVEGPDSELPEQAPPDSASDAAPDAA